MRFIWPLATPWITRDFYFKSWLYVGGQHMALDFGAAEGTRILAVAPGTVSDRGNDHYSGNYLGITHAEGWHSVYRHLVRPSPLAPGSPVTQGQAIGRVGNTGVSTGPHLHFDLWCKDRHSAEAILKRNWWAHDPELYLGQEDDMALTAEQHAMLQTIHHFAKIVVPAEHAWFSKQIKALEAANSARHKKVMNAIAAIETGGSGASPTQVLAKAKQALREGGG